MRFKLRTIDPGQSLPLHVAVRSPDCARPSGGGLWTLRAIDARVRVAGSERTQRLALDDPLRVRCRAPGAPAK